MTKEDLMPLAKTYFDSTPDLVEIFGTEDKHFFLREIQAQKYCKREKEYFNFNAEDFKEKKEESIKEPVQKVGKLTKKQLLQKEAKELGVDFEKNTTLADLETLIEIKKEEDN